MKDFIKNIENYKVYNLIVIITISFIILSINSFYYISAQLKNLAEQNRVLIVKDIQHITALWLLERITNIENSAKFLDNIFENEESTQRFASILSRDKTGFDAIQILVPDRYFYVNDKKMDDYINHYTYDGGKKRPFKENEDRWYENRKWFVEVQDNMKTIIERIDMHELFGEPSINMCTPIAKNGVFQGVFCGIIRATSLFDKIGELEIPTGGYYFISDSRGNILASFGNVSLDEQHIKQKFKKEVSRDTSITKNLYIDNEVIMTYKFENFDWYISVGMDEDEIKNNEAIRAFFKRTDMILVFFILFIIVVNGAYAFLNARASAKRREYERILAHNSRMSEVGELVSGINHQLRQPLNSLSLIISGTMELLSKQPLDTKVITNNLKLSDHSIRLMNKTIDIFRNFYRYSDAISEFYIKETVEHVLWVLDTNLSQNNITININDEPIKDLKIVSIENFIQQILLVLIQNAQDAIGQLNSIREFDKRKIEINFEVDEKNVEIYVSDFGCGVNKGSERSIFSVLHKSHKKSGFGMGLFFARKLANEKLKGDIMLTNNSNPTIFRFVVKKNIKDV